MCYVLLNKINVGVAVIKKEMNLNSTRVMQYNPHERIGLANSIKCARSTDFLQFGSMSETDGL